MRTVRPPAILLLVLLARAGFAAAQSAPPAAAPPAAAPPSAAPPSEAARPLPDMRKFLDHVRENLRSDASLLADYTFTEKDTEMRLDSKGGVKKTKTETYEVYPSEGPGKMYRRLVARDGKPLDEKEIAKQDKEQEERAERRRQRLENETQAERDKRAAKTEADKKKEREIVDELFRVDELVLEGRETIDDRSTIRISFTPRPGSKPASEDAEALHKLAGRAWMDEDNYQLVKLEATLMDSLGVGPARLIRLQKGAQAFVERRWVNNEIWLPARARFTGTAKALFFVLGRVDVQSECGDYKKFSVSTSESVSAEKTSN